MDLLLVEIEMPFVIDLGDFTVAELNESADYVGAVGFVHLLALGAFVLLQRLPKVSGVDKDNLVASVCGLVLVENPKVRNDTGVKELVGRHLNDGFDPVLVE